MNKFLIPPEYGLIVSAFNQTKSLRAAATLLETDPASLVRKAQFISHNHGLLHKVGNKWVVTDAGQRMAQWTDEFINSQKSLLHQKPHFRIAAFAWLAEEMLIPNFNKLDQQVSSQFEWSYKILLSDLEQELIQNRADYIVSGYAPNDPSIAHKKISNYPWVVAVPSSWKKNVIGIEPESLIRFLQTKPYIRMSNLNSSRVINFKQGKISNLSLDGVVGVRAAVAHGLGWSHLPAMSVKTLVNEKKIHVTALPTTIRDEVSVWWLRSRKDTSGNAKTLVKWISDFEMY